MIIAQGVTQLLSTFSFGEIILFIVLIAVAFKEIFNFLDWISEKVKKRDNKHQDAVSRDQRIDNQLENFQKELKHITETVDKINTEVNILKESDKDDIKAFITREHHYFCYTKGWIDDFSMDCIEKRYGHYVQENGNSYVADLMQNLRALPKQDPNSEKGAK